MDYWVVYIVFRVCAGCRAGLSQRLNESWDYLVIFNCKLALCTLDGSKLKDSDSR